MTCSKFKPVHTVLSTTILILAAIMIGFAVFLKISELPLVESALGVLQVHSEEPLFEDHRQSIADIKALKEMIYIVSFAANIFLLIGGLLFVRAIILVSVNLTLILLDKLLRCYLLSLSAIARTDSGHVGFGAWTVAVFSFRVFSFPSPSFYICWPEG